MTNTPGAAGQSFGTTPAHPALPWAVTLPRVGAESLGTSSTAWHLRTSLGVRVSLAVATYGVVPTVLRSQCIQCCPMTKSKHRAAIYARLSRNRSGEQSASTQRQVDACRELADQRGLDVVVVEVDDDVSAYSGKRRPGYERLMQMVDDGLVDVVLAWAPDRLHRRPVELEHFIDAVELAGVEVMTVQSGKVDLSTAAGRMQARMLGNVARYESEHRSDRTAAAHLQIAREGRWKGGKRPYGYCTGEERGMLYVIEDEAVVIRTAAARVLAGDRVGTIVRELNDQKVPTTTGAAWTTPTLRNLLLSPTVAGRRTHKGEDVGPAVWPAILDPTTAAQVRAVLTRGTRRGPVAKVSLLSGNRLTCGSCGSPMRTARRGNGARMYRCSGDGCGTVIAADTLDEIITELVLDQLDDAALPGPAPRRARKAGPTADEIERDLVELADAHGRGAITLAEYLAARAPMQARLDEINNEINNGVSRAALAGMTGKGAVRAAWPGLALDRRQAVVDAVIEGITIGRTTRRGRAMDTDRIGISWRA